MKKKKIDLEHVVDSKGEILVVEDNVPDSKFIYEVLNASGYSVRSASNGELALRSIGAKHPDLVLLDLKLPGIDGVQVCKKIKSDSSTKNIPVIFISAFGQHDLRLAALEAGAVDFVAKPIEENELLIRISTYIEMYFLQKALIKQADELQMEIDQHRLTEAALRNSEHKFFEIFQNSPLAILITRIDTGECCDVNQTFERDFGYSRDELIGFQLEKVNLWKNSEDEKRLREKFKNKGNFFEPAVNLISKFGKSLVMNIDFSKIRIEDQEFLMYSFFDITEKVELQNQLMQTQKLDSIGRLAGGVAHDFNNMLCVILGHVDRLLESIDRHHPNYPSLLEIKNAAEHSANLTKKLLAFARKQTISPKIIDLNVTIESMLSILRRFIGEDIDLSWFPGQDLWMIHLDPVQVEQILINLCINSRDSISDVGKITIETSNIELDENYCRENPDFIPGKYVLLQVSDNGFGMVPEILDKIFEPFFSTKEPGKGTGLGLSMVHGIVKQNGGFIHVYSEIGHGTSMKLYFQMVSGKAGNVNRVWKPAAHGTETLLVVEDELAILEMITFLLSEQGYKVLPANSPREAIAIHETYADPIHLLITDVIMPEMNGRDLSVLLSKKNPGLKTLFMSGYTENVIAHHGIIDQGIHFIQKPFAISGLTGKIREILCVD